MLIIFRIFDKNNIVIFIIMSRSYKKAIWKDSRDHREYHRMIRRNAKQHLNQGKEIPNPKTVVNDYDYCDYWFKCEFRNSIYHNEWKEKLSRK
jgi:hypothetical protein